jgi:hypothetical protein
MEAEIKGLSVCGAIAPAHKECGSGLRPSDLSPQFHVTFDPSFHTIADDPDDSLWQLKAGFISQREPGSKATAVKAPQEPQPK